MVNNIVHAVYSETYDLNTAVGELSLLGIHTPQAPQLKKMFAGFFQNYKKFRILGCNLKMVCASQQALDPSQLGLEAGQVDPRDILNPILFKACTGEHMNMLLDQIYSDLSNIGSGSVSQNVGTPSAAVDTYYQLLADDSFRKSHPQAGLEVLHLLPMVHKIVSTRPFSYNGARAHPQGTATGVGPKRDDIYGAEQVASAGQQFYSQENYLVSNGVTPMPWLDTAVPRSVAGQDGNDYQIMYYAEQVPRVYMGVIVLPPAILQRLFFRLTIVWHVEFRDFRPAQDMGGLYDVSPDGDIEDEAVLTGLSSTGGTYFNLYHNATPNKVVTKEQSSFTTTEGTEVSTVMEKGQ